MKRPVFYRLKTLFLTCRDATRLASRQLDESLSGSERAGLWIHFRICPWCHRYSRHLEFLHSALGKQPQSFEEQHEHLGPDAARRIQNVIDRAAEEPSRISD
jgi:hypothetical protein